MRSIGREVAPSIRCSTWHPQDCLSRNSRSASAAPFEHPSREPTFVGKDSKTILRQGWYERLFYSVEVQHDLGVGAPPSAHRNHRITFRARFRFLARMLVKRKV